MEKEKLKSGYDKAALEIINFETCDIVTASGGSDGYGGWAEDNLGWT